MEPEQEPRLDGSLNEPAEDDSTRASAGDSPRDPRRTGGLGPSVVVLSLLSATLIVTRGGERPAAPRAFVQTEVAQLADVTVWTGQRALAGGVSLRARLAPLHADPARQTFDAAALARRLELDSGQPWRLDLVHEGAAEAAPLRLAALAVEDRCGARLVPPSVALDAAAVDPLAGLFAAPPAVLPAGEQVSLVLWGPAPGAGARVVGLEGIASDGLDLVADRVPGDVLLQPLARVARQTRARDDR